MIEKPEGERKQEWTMHRHTQHLVLDTENDDRKNPIKLKRWAQTENLATADHS